jgi:beta-mannosidase
VKTKELELPNPELSLQTVLAEGGGSQVRVAARRLARSVRLSADGGEGHFSDNYFDLLPGEARAVDWTGPESAEFHVASIRDFSSEKPGSP